MYLKLPEDAPCVSVIVLSQWDIFNSSAVFFQVAFHMFEEPGFKVQPNSVDLMGGKQIVCYLNCFQCRKENVTEYYLIRLCVVSHGSCHYDCTVQRVLDALYKSVLLVF